MPTNRFREVPPPNYDYDVRRLVRAYEQALREVQAELNSLFLTDFERAHTVAVEADIREILADLRKYGNEWSKQTITRAAREGVASSIYSLGLTDSYAEALKIAQFNRMNRMLVDALIADTQNDLLAVTQNVSRRTRAAIRQAASEVMRQKAAAGVTGIQSIQQALIREIRQRLGNAADSAIIDAAGRRWKLRHYTEMLARTKSMQAHIEATVNDAVGRGVEYVVVSRHGDACPRCKPWEGRVLALAPNNPQGFPTVDDARADGLLHPSCNHVLSPIRRLDRLPKNLREINGITDQSASSQ